MHLFDNWLTDTRSSSGDVFLRHTVVNCVGSLVSEMSYTESSGTLSPTTHSLLFVLVEGC